jgi:hypothetical protein
MVINFVTEFLFQSLVVFRKTINTNALAKRKAQSGKALPAEPEEKAWE